MLLNIPFYLSSFRSFVVFCFRVLFNSVCTSIVLSLSSLLPFFLSGVAASLLLTVICWPLLSLLLSVFLSCFRSSVLVHPRPSPPPPPTKMPTTKQVKNTDQKTPCPRLVNRLDVDNVS